MYGKDLTQDSFYLKLTSTIYASTQIAVLYIGMYYNVTLGLPLIDIAVISIIIFFYDNFIKSFSGKIINNNKNIFQKKFYLLVFILLASSSLIFLFNADKYMDKKNLVYYYFFALLIYETIFTSFNIYCDCWSVNNASSNKTKKRSQFAGLAISAVAFPIIHYFTDFTKTAIIFAAAGVIVSVYIIIKHRKTNAPPINCIADKTFNMNKIKYIFSCKKYFRVLVIYLLFESAWLITICSFPVYTKFSLHSTFLPVALFQFSTLVPVIIFKYFYAQRIKSSKKTYFYSLSFCIIASLLYFFSNGIFITSLAGLIFGLGYAKASLMHENDLSAAINTYAITDNSIGTILKYFNDKSQGLCLVLKNISLCSLTFIFGYASGIDHGLHASTAWRFAYGIIPIFFISIIFVFYIFITNKQKNPS